MSKNLKKAEWSNEKKQKVKHQENRIETKNENVY